MFSLVFNRLCLSLVLNLCIHVNRLAMLLVNKTCVHFVAAIHCSFGFSHNDG